MAENAPRIIHFLNLKMMKKNLRTLLFLMLAGGAAQAQWTNNSSWDYSFGTGTGTHTSGNSPSTTATAGFLPSPPSGVTGVFIATSTGGGFVLNGDNTLTEKLTTSNNLSRFSANSITSATDVVMHSFKIRFSAATASVENGNYIYAIGNSGSGPGQGNLFSVAALSNVYRSSSELFTALRFTPATAANTSTIKFEYRVGSDASATTSWLTIDQTTFVKGTEYDVAIYCNNSAVNQTYKIGLTSYILPSNTFNLWVAGAQVGTNFLRSVEVTGNGGLNSGTSIAFANGTPINAFLFNAAGNTGATGSITLTAPKLTYSTASVLPVSLISFTGQKAVNGTRLNWKTASELNNDHFDVLRSTDGQVFSTLTSIAGNGTTNQVNAYSYLDNAPTAGTNYYKLKQVDKDGTANVSDIVVAVNSDLNSAQAFSANLSNNTLNASFDASAQGTVNISLTDLSGRNVFTQSFAAQSGLNNISVAVPSLNAGIYVATLVQNGKSKSIKIVK